LTGTTDNGVITLNGTAPNGTVEANLRFDGTTLTVTGNATISGDLTVSGTTTYINTTTLNVGDNIITLNADIGASTTPTENAGIEVKRGNAATKAFYWEEANDRWYAEDGLYVAGNVVLSGTVDSGQGATEVHLMNQNIRTTDSVTFSNVTSNGRFLGGFGAVTTGGTADWNDISNTYPGSGYTLLLGNASNGPNSAVGLTNYFHAFNFEYSSKNGTGNITQLGIAYGTPGNELVMRGRYDGTWSSWVRFLTNSNSPFAYRMNQDVRTTDAVTFATVNTGQGANELYAMDQNVRTTDSPTFNKIRVTAAGNSSGGNILMGPAGEGSSKFSTLTGTHYNATSQAQGITLIGAYATAAVNQIYIGGNIYEANPATQIDFYTHTAITHGTGGSVKMSINSSGNITANVDFRAPIFYDSDNTAYFINGASNSNLNTLQAYSYQGNSNVAGTGNASYHPSGIYSTGTNWLYGTMYLNVNSINDAADIRLYNASYHFRARYTAGSDNYHSSLNWYGLQLGNNGDNYIIAGRTNVGGRLRFFVNNTTDFTSINGTEGMRLDSDGRLYSYIDTRSPIFYDYDNTAYYVDPASTSNLNGLTVAGTISGTAQRANHLNTTRDTPDNSLQYWQAPGLGITEAPTGDWHNTIRMGHGSPLSYYSNTLAVRMTGSGPGDIYTQCIQNGTRQGWKKHWNDGGTIVSAYDISAPVFYDYNNSGYYGDFASTSNLNALATQYQYILGQTTNGQSHYQWEGATYRNPGTYTSRLIVRQDNSSTGINGFMPSLVVYNNNGGDQTTSGIVFASAEAATGAGNSVNLAGIIAKKEAAGNNGGWSPGSLTFFTKNYGTKNDAQYIGPDGRIGFGTTSFTYTTSDNTAVVSGGINSNRLFVNGSIQLLNDADAFVVGRGTSTFLKDEELGFGWGGGWYMVDSTYLRVRGSKILYNDYIIRSDTDMRAPVFYDQNDTSFYMDYYGGGVLRGNFEIASDNNSSTSYSVAAIELRESQRGSSGGYLAPRLAFHWGGVVASQIGIESGGRISILNNPGTGYENLIANAMYATIFYDTNDTSYYVDPHSTSYQRSLFLGAHDSGTAEFRFGEDSSGWYGDRWYWDSGYNVYRYSRYAGSDSLIHYHDTRDASRITYGRNIVFDDYGKGIVGNYDSTRLQLVFAMGDAYKISTNGAATNNMYGIAWSHPNAGGLGGANNLNDHGMLIINNGSFRASISSRIVASEEVRGTLFRDYNDTGFYVNPNGTSIVDIMEFGGDISTNTSNGSKIFGMFVPDGKYQTRNWHAGDGGYVWGGMQYVTGISNSPIGSYSHRGPGAWDGWRQSGWVPIDRTKTYKVSAWIRSVSGNPYCYLSFTQAAYDYAQPDNGGWGQPYYFAGPPPSTWTEYTMTIGPAGSGAGYTWYGYARFMQLGFLHNYLYSGYSGQAEFIGFKIEEVDNTLAANTSVLGDIYATRFVDSNDGGYYLDPNGVDNQGLRMRGGALHGPNWTWGQYLAVGTNGHWSGGYASVATTDGNLHLDSKSGNGLYLQWYVGGPVYVNNDIHAQIFYDRNNTAFYTDPASTSRLNALQTDDRIVIGGNFSNNAYNAVGSTRLHFGGGDGDANGNYYIGTNLNNYGGNYTKLDLRWHTGIRMGAQPSYGGIRIYNNEDLDSRIASFGETDSNVRIDNILYVFGDARAPIFYDQNNTGYYLNPDGTSYLYHLILSGASYFRPNTWIQMDGNYGIYWPGYYGAHIYPNTGSSYTQLRFDGQKNGYDGLWLSYSAVNGMMYDGGGNGGVYREANGRWYFYYHLGNDCMGIGTSSTSSTWSLYLNKGVYAQSRIDATIYYDTNDAGYYIDPTGNSNWQGLTLRGKAQTGLTGKTNWKRPDITGNSDYWTGIMGWGTEDFNSVMTWGSGFIDTWSNPANQPSGTSHWVGVQAHHYTNAYGSAYGWQMVGGPIGNLRFRQSWPSVGAWRTIPMHDVNDGSGGTLYAGSFSDANDTGYFCDPNGRSRLSSMDYGNGGYYFAGGDWGYRHNTPSGWIQFGPANGSHAHIYTNLSNFYLNAAIQVNGVSIMYTDDIRTRVFYDVDNTGYYIDANNNSSLNRANVSLSRFGSSGDVAQDFRNTPAGTMRHNGDDANLGSSPGGTWWFYDHYRHSNGSNFWGVQVAWGWEDQANRLATRNVTGGSFGGWVYYLNSSNFSSYALSRSGDTMSSILYFLTNNGGQAVNNSSSAALQAYSTGNNSAYMSFHKGGHYAINMGLDNDNVFRIGGWSAAANRFVMDMSGNLTMAGNVTAYSDIRVKENIVTIENGLDKVLGMRGVYYNRTDSDDKRTQVGVIAQEMLDVLPEIVSQDNLGMYNVAYGNISAVLIEAIKELKGELDDARNEIKQLRQELLKK
jgi:hypothetical protein